MAQPKVESHKKLTGLVSLVARKSKAFVLGVITKQNPVKNNETVSLIRIG